MASLLPLPFSRELLAATPPLTGPDVTILQNLLLRAECNYSAPTGVYDAPTGGAVACFQRQRTLNASGAVDNATAWHLLEALGDDGWQDDGRSAADLGDFLYKVLLPVHRNRSVETTATLLDAHNNVLLQFPARAHGHDVDAAGQRIDGIAWPDLTDDGCPHASARQSCVGLNTFSSSGATPTGLVEIDLNSPESSPELYGPYPVNRFVRGLSGNAAILLPAIRNGILIHSGQWANHSSWKPGAPMPNSAGCVHSYLPDIQRIAELLVHRCAVAIRPNTDGKLPYPYKPQGVAAVFVVD